MPTEITLWRETAASDGRSRQYRKRETRRRILLHDRKLATLLELVRRRALELKQRLPMHIEIDELEGDGMVGLVQACDNYNFSRGVPFEVYANRRIVGAMLDGLRLLDPGTRPARARAKHVERVFNMLQLRLGRRPESREVARALGLSLDEWYKMAAKLRTLGVECSDPFAAQKLAGWRNDLDPDQVPDTRQDPFEICHQEEKRRTLRGALTVLPKREQQIVFLYYFRDLTMNKIGQVLGIDESRVSQLHKAVLQKLKRVISKE